MNNIQEKFFNIVTNLIAYTQSEYAIGDLPCEIDKQAGQGNLNNFLHELEKGQNFPQFFLCLEYSANNLSFNCRKNKHGDDLLCLVASWRGKKNGQVVSSNFATLVFEKQSNIDWVCKENSLVDILGECKETICVDKMLDPDEMLEMFCSSIISPIVARQF